MNEDIQDMDYREYQYCYYYYYFHLLYFHDSNFNIDWEAAHFLPININDQIIMNKNKNNNFRYLIHEK